MKTKKTISIILILFLMIGIFFVARVDTLDINYNSFCKLKYGKNWYHLEYNLIGDYCIEIRGLNFTTTQRIKINKQEAKIICGIPKFWELWKWENRC